MLESTSDVASDADDRPDFILHLASPASPVDYDRMPVGDLAANSLGTWRLLEIARGTGAKLTSRLDVRGLRRPARAPAAGDVLGQRGPRRASLLVRREQALRRGALTSMRRSNGVRARRSSACSTRTARRMRADDGRVIPELLGSPRRAGRSRSTAAAARPVRSVTSSDLVRGLLLVGLDRQRRRDLQYRQSRRDHDPRAGGAHPATSRARLGSSRFDPRRTATPQRRCPDISRIQARYGWQPRVDLDEGLRGRSLLPRLRSPKPRATPAHWVLNPGGHLMTTRVLVTGAGGFIGHHLVTDLKRRGYWVRGVDLKLPEYTASTPTSSSSSTSARWDDCLRRRGGIDEVYALAADMGGMGFISAHHAEILHNNALINLHTIEAARPDGGQRYLYTSSACVYPEYLQTDTDVKPLREEDAYPAQPQDAYGWEKLVTEKLCEYYASDYGIETRIVRFHNIYGPNGTYDGGREKAPAALCRKVAARRGRRRDRDLGRRRADPLVLLRRRLRRGHLPADAVGPPRAAQPRHRPDGHDQRAGRDHHRDLRQARHQDPPRPRPAGRPRPQLRQHAPARGARLGAADRRSRRAWRRRTSGSSAQVGRPPSEAAWPAAWRPRVDPAGRRPRRRRQRRRHGDGRRRDRRLDRATASSTTCASPASTASWRASATRSC